MNLLSDLQSCIKRACGGKPKKKGKTEPAGESPSLSGQQSKPVAVSAEDGPDGVRLLCAGGNEELQWVEVIVEVLLALLAQSSGLIRRVCKSVFGLVCQHMTKGALQLILDVSGNLGCW